MLSPIVRSPFQRLSPLNHRLRGSFHLTAYCAKKSEMYEAVSTAAAENANYFQEDSTPSGTALFCGFKLLAKQCRDVRITSISCVNIYIHSLILVVSFTGRPSFGEN